MTITDKELREIAELHKSCLPNSHIGRLPIWMIIAFYRNMNKDADFELFLKQGDGRIIGAAVISKKGFGATKNMLPIAAYFLLLVKNPIQVLKSIVSASNSSDKSTDTNIEFLFVDSSYRSSGIGSKLLQSVMEKFDEICVSTRNSDDNKAIGFYIRNGFKPIGSQVIVGRDLKIYKWKN